MALRRALTPSNHFHAAIWAVALVTFFGCRRLGETTVNSGSSFNPSLHVLRSAEYVCSLYFFSLIQAVHAVSLSPLCETARAQHPSAYLGQKPLVKRVLPSSSLPVTTNCALAQPCAIISPSIMMSLPPRRFSPTPPRTEAGNI